MDVSSEVQVEEGVVVIVKVFGGVDVLISNVGIQIVVLVVDFIFDNWKKMFVIYFDGVFLIICVCMCEMFKVGKGGSIIYMGFVYLYEVLLLKSVYVVVKYGLFGLVWVVVKEGVKDCICVNVICLGYVCMLLVDK